MIDWQVVMAEVLDPDGHNCVAPDCMVRVRFGMLMCKRHWRMVPQGIQRRINHEWRLWRVHASTTAPQAWRAGVDDAVAAIAQVEVVAHG